MPQSSDGSTDTPAELPADNRSCESYPRSLRTRAGVQKTSLLSHRSTATNVSLLLLHPSPPVLRHKLTTASAGPSSPPSDLRYPSTQPFSFCRKSTTRPEGSSHNQTTCCRNVTSTLPWFKNPGFKPNPQIWRVSQSYYVLYKFTYLLI